MEKCMDTVVDWMVQRKAINETERDLYKYALHSFFLLLFPLVLAGGFGIFIGSITEGITLVLPFMIVRKFSGGYHSRNLWSCMIGSSLLLFLCTMLAMWVKCDLKLLIATIIASISLIVFSPIDNESRTLDYNEKRTYKKVTFFCVMVFWLLDMILFFLGWYVYVVYFSIGIQLSAGLQIPCIAKKIFQMTKKRP